MRKDEAAPAEDEVAQALARLPELADADLVRRGRFLTVACLFGTPSAPLHVTIEAGQVVEVLRGPVLMRSWRFAYRATPEAWAAFWEPVPRPGFHDLLALTKRGAATLEGDLQPFIANLQYFKDLLALPRGSFGKPVGRAA
ncbi:hypothetical protein [Enterovirga rhinocerotis]|uniref:SCP2 domain-containing protein n=1 Tax=Enterovirga rhinocerotis TaxID=1339210 RepID=A0A4R7BJW3_9HYPH|nr:hypothetical protein [Enterovirga rhinocerotis]TDR85491.1 hypothetical protein EV668_4613 [Enterovirga rhinocerotis]